MVEVGSLSLKNTRMGRLSNGQMFLRSLIADFIHMILKL